ncbi:DUF4839 domain-containing protein [Rhodococcus hoagii]|nr:DUF4839 domain-containing protein [Prescottella equi]NKR41207.1 DUF4839 domain-containing protein [Prescottella equi]
MGRLRAGHDQRGTNLSITAKVDRYEERSCLFPLEPVTTAVR